MQISDNWIDIAYLISAVLFVLGIKGLTKPKTAVRGNLLAASVLYNGLKRLYQPIYRDFNRRVSGNTPPEVERGHSANSPPERAQ